VEEHVRCEVVTKAGPLDTTINQTNNITDTEKLGLFIYLFTSTKSTTECYIYYKHIMQDPGLMDLLLLMTHEWVLAPVLAPMLAPTLGLYKLVFTPPTRGHWRRESRVKSVWTTGKPRAVINPTVVRLSVNKFLYKVTQCSSQCHLTQILINSDNL